VNRAGGDPALDGDPMTDRLVLRLRTRPADVSEARHAVAGYLSARGVSSIVVDDMELVTSELVTNAVVHGRRGSIGVEVDAENEIVVTVSNLGPAQAIPPIEDWRAASPLAPSGRGLGIVRRLCDDVAVLEIDDTTVVVCRRRVPDSGGAR
jgi:anti-sigma regulatory factor (Ser/Thr protein kinase)